MKKIYKFILISFVVVIITYIFSNIINMLIWDMFYTNMATLCQDTIDVLKGVNMFALLMSIIDIVFISFLIYLFIRISKLKIFSNENIGYYFILNIAIGIYLTFVLVLIFYDVWIKGLLQISNFLLEPMFIL